MDPESGEKLNDNNNPDNREVYSELGESSRPEPTAEELKELAAAYARYLAEQDLVPGDMTFTEPEDLVMQEVPEEPAVEEQVAAAPEKEPEEAKKTEKKKTEKKKQPAKEKKEKKPNRLTVLFTQDVPDEEAVRSVEEELAKRAAKKGPSTAAIDLHDRLQDGLDERAAKTGRDFVTASHKVVSSYRNSRRVIGFALLIIGVLAAVILAIFDAFTVYEYSYNGKLMGYVRNQEDVMDVLEIAGTKLTENNPGRAEVVFTANQNVTFNVVDGRGKSTDTSDVAVNKLVYLTDIETEAYGVYDGDNLVAIVKSQEDAEQLLEDTMRILSEPDEGMDLVSSEFTNDLSISPINVLLTSVQSNTQARTTMTEGGKIEIYHIVEGGESLTSLATSYGVDMINIYNENNSEVAAEIEQGDMVCIRKEISPVSVKMVEKGRMREIIEYETIKEDSEDYYEGDTHVEQEGVDGIQIFEGTVTKVAGEVTKRDTDDIEVIREKKDKIILIGTAERPKTAATGTYKMPLDSFVLTSNFGYRWGRLHAGIDMGAPGGAPIYATDGGTVIRASWYSGYGNCVDIEHSDGRVTRYGHCSRILVGVGDKVYQGQEIALVGNTGHSFGNHLHFEIILNGSPVNPRPYLGI